MSKGYIYACKSRKPRREKLSPLTRRDANREEMRQSWGVQNNFNLMIRAAMAVKAANCSKWYTNWNNRQSCIHTYIASQPDIVKSSQVKSHIVYSDERKIQEHAFACTWHHNFTAIPSPWYSQVKWSEMKSSQVTHCLFRWTKKAQTMKHAFTCIYTASQL